MIVRQLTIDATPERYGKSPMLDIVIMLEKKGYELSIRGNFLAARAEAS